MSDQADSARRPLRRRPDTIARPARVRMRKRKPCTRARRRLFGWKVRLPLATAFSSSVSARSFPSHPAAHAWSDCVRLRVGRRCVLLLAGAVPGHINSWVAAVSPTFGRLFEGTDERSLGQTWPAPTDPPTPNMKSCPSGTPSGTTPIDTPQDAPADPKEADSNATELLAAARKTVSFGQCRFRLERRSTTKRGWRIYLAVLGDLARVVSSPEIASRRR